MTFFGLSAKSNTQVQVGAAQSCQLWRSSSRNRRGSASPDYFDCGPGGREQYFFITSIPQSPCHSGDPNHQSFCRKLQPSGKSRQLPSITLATPRSALPSPYYPSSLSKQGQGFSGVLWGSLQSKVGGAQPVSLIDSWASRL